MKINKVIRQYRKMQNLTQEQIANYLGVTAPAVNKWENGISYPDITLLAPLARILKIDVDTLLSFNEELTDIEINQLVKEISDSVENDGYEEAFEKGEKLIREYTSCDKLILATAEVLNAFIKIKNIDNPDLFEKKIISWYELVATSKEEKVAIMGNTSLALYYMNKKEYEMAQQFLDKIPPLGYDKRIVQGMLYENQLRNEEAYELYEHMIYSGINQIIAVLHLICNMLCKEHKYDEAEKYANLTKEVALLFDLGAYIAYSPSFIIAMEKQDKEQGIEMLERLIGGIETMLSYHDSKLYSHMKFNKEVKLDVVKNMIRNAFEKDCKLDFIKDEPRAKNLFKRLEE